jgi:hypothetical protein
MSDKEIPKTVPFDGVTPIQLVKSLSAASENDRT